MPLLNCNGYMMILLRRSQQKRRFSHVYWANNNYTFVQPEPCYFSFDECNCPEALFGELGPGGGLPLLDANMVRNEGDLNGDGNVNVFDALSLIDVVLEIEPASTQCGQQAGDLNNDSNYDLLDILSLVDIILN